MAELTGTVHVYDEDGVVQVFGPGDTVPPWAAKKIKNPKLWGGEQVPTAPQERKIPPKTGPKGTVEAWRSYAADHGLTIPDDASRKDIIGALEAEGIETE